MKKIRKIQIFDIFWLPQECTFFLKKTPFLRKSQISPISQFSRRDIFQKTGASTINPFVQHVYRSYSPQNKILEVYASYCGTCALFTEKNPVSPHVYTTLKNLPNVDFFNTRENMRFPPLTLFFDKKSKKVIFESGNL